MSPVMYILLCRNDFYYIGSTTNLKLSLAEHSEGEGAKFTRKMLPIKLIYYESFDKIEDAFKREKQIKKWSRKKKKALIEGDIKLLKELASCKNNSHSKFK